MELSVLFSWSKLSAGCVIPKETSEGWPLLTVETEVNEDSKRTNEKDPLCWFVELGALQIHNTENSKQILPEKELRSLSPNFHIHRSVSKLYIPTLCLPILLQENMWTEPGKI